MSESNDKPADQVPVTAEEIMADVEQKEMLKGVEEETRRREALIKEHPVLPLAMSAITTSMAVTTFSVHMMSVLTGDEVTDEDVASMVLAARDAGRKPFTSAALIEGLQLTIQMLEAVRKTSENYNQENGQADEQAEPEAE